MTVARGWTHLPYAQLGLKGFQLQAVLASENEGPPWRVSGIDRGLCDVMGLDERGEASGKRVRPGIAPLAVGDWVMLDERCSPPQIVEIIERSSVLERGATDDEGRSQLIAANLDVVFVVVAFAESVKLERRALNVRRIERYVSAIRAGGALPAVLLNKVDIAAHDDDALRDLLRTLSERLGQLDVMTLSASTSRGLEQLEPYLAPGQTVAFVGLSGVGKSSLVNRWLGVDQQAVSGVRTRDTKGRHTTSRRQLIRADNGALLIDTPGMRQFAVVCEEDTLFGFEDIDALARRCKFSDCAHDREPGCAVRSAVDTGDLEADRLDSFLAIRNDAQRLRSKRDSLARHRGRQEEKTLSRAIREVLANKKRR
jgi:ribosome biogenesis GTPase